MVEQTIEREPILFQPSSDLQAGCNRTPGPGLPARTGRFQPSSDLQAGCNLPRLDLPRRVQHRVSTLIRPSGRMQLLSKYLKREPK